MYQFPNTYADPPAVLDGAINTDDPIEFDVIDFPPNITPGGDPFPIYMVDDDTAELMLVTDVGGSPFTHWTATRLFGAGNPGAIVAHADASKIYFPTMGEALLALRDWNNLINVPSEFAPEDHAASHTEGGTDEVAITEAQLSFSDILTNDVSISQHGLTPKAPNDSTQFLNGVGGWAVPTGGGSGTVNRGTYASRPAVGNAGAIYIASDTPIWSYDTGAAWIEYYGTHELVNDAFPSTWVNQNSSTTDTSKGGLFFFSPHATGQNSSLLVKAVPTRPYTITIAVISHHYQPTSNWGLGWRESGSGKFAGVYIQSNATTTDSRWKLISGKFTSPTVFNANYTAIDYPHLQIHFLRIVEEAGAGNRIIYSSADGVNWVAAFHSVGRTDFLTADQVCLFQQSVTLDGGIWVLSWDES